MTRKPSIWKRVANLIKRGYEEKRNEAAAFQRLVDKQRALASQEESDIEAFKLLMDAGGDNE